ncbi:MAG: hypothetical protein ACPG5U_09885 [Planktomarina sp.]
MKMNLGTIVTISIAVVILGLMLAVWAGGPGQGEVSSILFGAFLAIGMCVLAYLCVVALLSVFWHKKAVRLFLLFLILGPIVAGISLASYGYIEDRKADAEYQQYKAEQEAKITRFNTLLEPLVAQHIRTLTDSEFDPNTLSQLNAAFIRDTEAAGISMLAHTSNYWYFISYLGAFKQTMATPDTEPLPPILVYAHRSRQACLDFYDEFSHRFTARKQETYQMHCVDFFND